MPAALEVESIGMQFLNEKQRTRRVATVHRRIGVVNLLQSIDNYTPSPLSAD